MPLGAEPSPRLSKDNGFRNVQMGQDRESIEGLQRRKMWDDKALGLRAYAMKKEYKLVGAATVERIIYRFLDDQVYSIEVLGEGLMACDTLLAVLTEMYGPGKKGQSGYDQMTWWGEDVTLMFTSMVDCSAEYIWLSKYREIVVGEGSTAAP